MCNKHKNVAVKEFRNAFRGVSSYQQSEFWGPVVAEYWYKLVQMKK